MITSESVAAPHCGVQDLWRDNVSAPDALQLLPTVSRWFYYSGHERHACILLECCSRTLLKSNAPDLALSPTLLCNVITLNSIRKLKAVLASSS